ncbi:hypothetical protein SBV1_250024 [Verrucomicrobia bacterium]|nr:hypothetical protein SBV1_250024 [Verrucomicrobiota bacterium]
MEQDEVSTELPPEGGCVPGQGGVDCHRSAQAPAVRVAWSTSAGRRLRARLGSESGSKLRALQTLREVGSHSIIQRTGILLELRLETGTYFCTDP